MFSSHRKEVWIMDPATDMYYYWLCTISIPVFYNLILLVARSDLVRDAKILELGF